MTNYPHKPFAVVVALDLIERGERGTNEGDFVDAVIKRVVSKADPTKMQTNFAKLNRNNVPVRTV